MCTVCVWVVGGEGEGGEGGLAASPTGSDMQIFVGVLKNQRLRGQAHNKHQSVLPHCKLSEDVKSRIATTMQTMQAVRQMARSL